MFKTKLVVEIFLPKLSEWCHGIRPYRNSGSPREGLTISLKEFRKLGAPEKVLKIGTKFDLTVVVEGKDEMTLIPGHINKKGGYIPCSIVERFELLQYLPLPRVKMGDRQLGIDYVINVNSVTFYSGELAVTVGETIQEVGSEDSLTVEIAEATATENTNVKQNEVVTESVDEAATETIRVEEWLSEEQSENTVE